MTGRVPEGWPDPAATPYVKICGLTEPALAEAAVAAGADMIGLVHFAPSPRHVDEGQAAEIAAAARGALVVALTVDADDGTLDALVRRAAPGALQLHGQESPERVDEVGARYGLLMSKAIGVAAPGDLARVHDYKALPVLDAKPPRGADRPGGHGNVFDWSMLSDTAGLPGYMLCGGLDAHNVKDAVATLHPYAVDVSSKVETDGRKDPQKVARFVEAAKGVPLLTR
ncbi:MAG: phosphoribosylanthranilate isomerase [Pseudomonadota bacterium]